MALPHTYTQTINTVTTAALDAYTTDLTQVINDGDYTFLKKLASKGRIKSIKDCEKISHPLLNSEASTTVRYNPSVGTSPSRSTVLSGNSGLAATAYDVLDKALFTIQSATDNINYPQADPAGEIVSTVMARTKAAVMRLLKEEERLFLRGVITSPGTADSLPLHPFVGDGTNYADGYSMSLPALMAARDMTGGSAGAAADPIFGNVSTANYTDGQWSPQLETTASATGANLLQDFQVMWNNANFGGMEIPDYLLTSQGVWNKFVDLLRDKSTINDRVVENMGVDGREVPYSGMTVAWSRELSTLKSTDYTWDITGGAQKEAPCVALNMKSLRWNTVAGAGVADPAGTGVYQFLNEAQLHPLKTNYFRRIASKGGYSLEHGRRSFSALEGLTLVD